MESISTTATSKTLQTNWTTIPSAVRNTFIKGSHKEREPVTVTRSDLRVVHINLVVPYMFKWLLIPWRLWQAQTVSFDAFWPTKATLSANSGNTYYCDKIGIGQLLNYHSKRVTKR